MTRTTILIAEPIPFEGLSTRKLVLETAYFNVLTAYSTPELLETVKRFPAIDAVVVHAELPGYSAAAMKKLRSSVEQMKIILLSSSGHQKAEVADVVLSSHDPQVLLTKVREYFGSPEVSDLLRRVRPR